MYAIRSYYGTDCYNAEEGSIYGEKVPESAWKIKDTKGYYTLNPMPSEKFEHQWLEKVKEVVDGYSPDLLWFDNRIKILSENVRQEMMAYAYNHAAKNKHRITSYNVCYTKLLRKEASNAAAAWEKLAKIADSQYKPQLLARTRELDWIKTQQFVNDDIEIVKSSTGEEPKIVRIFRTGYTKVDDSQLEKLDT